MGLFTTILLFPSCLWELTTGPSLNLLKGERLKMFDSSKWLAIIFMSIKSIYWQMLHHLPKMLLYCFMLQHMFYAVMSPLGCDWKKKYIYILCILIFLSGTLKAECLNNLRGSFVDQNSYFLLGTTHSYWVTLIQIQLNQTKLTFSVKKNLINLH